MDLDRVSGLHLRYFLAVAEQGSVAGAARALGVAQPSLSQQVRLLEKHMGVRLFDRASTGMSPTAAGEQLAQAARSWFTAASEVSRQSMPVRVGVPRGMDPAAIDLLHERLGDGIALVACSTAEAPAMLRRRQLDAAVVRGPVQLEGSGLAVEHLASRSVGLVAAVGVLDALPRDGQGRIPVSELEGLSLVWFDESRAPAFARYLLDAIRAAEWFPDLVRLDPASSAMTEDAVGRRRDLAMLRPQPPTMAPQLAWAAIDWDVEEELVILCAQAR